MLKVILLIVSMLSSQFLWSQAQRISPMDNVSPEHMKIYKIHPKWEVPVSLALIGAASLGYKWMDKRASLTAEQVVALDPMNINSFDRPAAYYDPATFKSAQSKSDILMTALQSARSCLSLTKR
jgi:hypothetical protein